MWLEIKQSKEWVPFDTEHTDKVFYDGEKGWAVKQKDGKVYHVTQEQYEKKLLRELDSEAYWKIRQVEDAAQGLTEDDIKRIKKMLKGIEKKREKKDEDDD